jgi:hypothetical protein
VTYDARAPLRLARLNMVAVATLFVQPVFVSKVLILIVQPLTLVLGIRGIRRVLDEAGPTLRLCSAAALSFCVGFLACVGLASACGLALTLLCWVCSGSALFTPAYAPMLLLPLGAAVIAVVAINSLGALAARLAERDGRINDRDALDDRSTRSTLRGSPRGSPRRPRGGGTGGEVQAGGAAKPGGAEGAAGPPSPARVRTLGLTEFALASSTVSVEAQPRRRSRLARAMGSVHHFIVFYFYWQEYSELRLVRARGGTRQAGGRSG